MGSYFVSRGRHYKSGLKVQFREWVKLPDKPELGYVARCRHIPTSEYGPIGITPEMTFEQVRAVLKTINADLKVKARHEAMNRIKGRMAADASAIETACPPEFVKKFEQDHLPTRYLGNPPRLAKVLKLWRAAQRAVASLQRPVDQWWRYPEPLYAFCEARCYSPGYVRNVVATLNAWIEFYGAETGKDYRPVPAPKGSWLARIATAFEESDGSRTSVSLTPAQLMGKATELAPGHYNWLHCSVWAGLRPNEVNALLNAKRTKVRYEGETPILCIYQSKLKNVHKTEDRWKYIPLILPEQRTVLTIIESKEIEEPSVKRMQNLFGPSYGRYAGRKGFHDLMVTTYGQPELEVCRWLGHRSLDMALRHYAKKDSVRWTPIGKKE